MRRVRLRRWQRAALDAWREHPRRDFLAVATPGAGKTTFALTAAVHDLAAHPHRRLLAVAPTSHLKVQWADAAARFGLHLECDWSTADRRLPHDMHGVVVTYQQVAAAPRVFARLSDDAFVVLDEIHHAASEQAWGDAVGVAFRDAARRLSLSGTPFRSDDAMIPFVRYEFDEAVADFTYGYDDALADGGVVRPVFFPRLGGHMEWTTPDGALQAATFDDPLDRVGASQRLRTALSLDSEWLPDVLTRADEQLRRLRESDPAAGGLVIAMDVEHARGVAGILERRTGARPVVATSDDPRASDRIAAFAGSRDRWLVAVRMVSEGVDIPRLRVGVYATNVVTELFFRQAVGRFVRWTPGPRRQKAFLFLPDDPRLAAFAGALAQRRTHTLRRRERDGVQPPVDEDRLDARDDGQMSLFQAISATPLGGDAPTVFDDDHPEDLILVDDPQRVGVEIELPRPPLPGGGVTVPTDGDGRRDDRAPVVPVSRARRKRELRRELQDRVHLLANLTGEDHRVINGRLNAEAGIQSVDDATLRELEARLRAADRWLDAV